MMFRHGMVDGDKMLIFHVFNGDSVIIVRFFCFQRRQCNTAAADQCIPHAMDHIATDRAGIKLRTQRIGRYILIDDMLAVHQLNNGDAQGLSQWLQ